MLSSIKSAATFGVNAYQIQIETHLENSIPKFFIVGLPDNAVSESRERVSAAIKNSGFVYPNKKITVNLAPADIKKEGSSYDLPIAIGLLAASNQISTSLLQDFIIVGELALDGSVRLVHGILPISIEIKNLGLRGIILPKENANEAAMVAGIEVYSVENLGEAVSVLNNDSKIFPVKINPEYFFKEEQSSTLDMNDVKGQENVKRSLEVASAGGHNVIMIGPPGSGKTMLARRVPTILTPMSFDESLETTKIHSIAGLLPPNKALVAVRPFRSPHHTISDSALVGGGTIPRPGEISLAHHGVLFLDELPEFDRSVLEVLRQPLEDGKVLISRSKLSLEFPASFMLICSMNPCPCGNFGSKIQQCSCSPIQIQKYMGKISGPLLDRIDIHIEVPAVNISELSQKKSGENSQTIRERVIFARSKQSARFKNIKGVFCNANMNTNQLREFCKINSEGEEILKMAISKLGLSARAYDRILKVSRTIADLANSESISVAHLSEAIQYRSLDRNLWFA